jgi:hypothetical protein
MLAYMCVVSQKPIQKKIQIGNHALPEVGFGLSTPRGAERGGATPRNTGRGRQGERLQAAGHQVSSKRGVTNRHCRISNISPNQQEIAGNNRAHSNAKRGRTSGQKAERNQEPRHAKAANSSRVKRVNVQRLAHPRSSDRIAGQKLQEVQPQIGRIRTAWRTGFATEQVMLDAPPAALNAGVSTSCGRRRPGDANLTTRARTEPMQRQSPKAQSDRKAVSPSFNSNHFTSIHLQLVLVSSCNSICMLLM